MFKTSCVWVQAPFSPENGPEILYAKAVEGFAERQNSISLGIFDRLKRALTDILKRR